MIRVDEEVSAGYFTARERALRYPPKFSAQMASVGYFTVSDRAPRYPPKFSAQLVSVGYLAADTFRLLVPGGIRTCDIFTLRLNQTIGGRQTPKCDTPPDDVIGCIQGY